MGIEEGRKEEVRIYVGGLGESVTEDDLRATFSSQSLGLINSVHIVRTKGRSFAYMDFLPSSSSSVSKLFSKYNGCAWRGGKLRLEKAKEHYLVRLKREWAQDAEIAASKSNPSTTAPQELEKPKKAPNLENMKLRIFFPKLRKVKLLHFSGTGKHKYSFPRVDVPSSLPLHFCGCEEHSDFSCMPKGTNHDSDTQKGGVDEQELNMMNMVMNRLFERDIDSNTVLRRTDEMASEKPTSKLDPLIDENEANDMIVDDNLITNITNGAMDIDVLLESQKRKRITVSKETRLDESKAFKDLQTQHHKNTKKKSEPAGASFPTSNKRKKLNSTKESGGGSHLKKSKVLLQEHQTEPESLVRPSETNPNLAHISAQIEVVGDGRNSDSGVSLSTKKSTSSHEEKPELDDINASNFLTEKDHNLANHISGNQSRDLKKEDLKKVETVTKLTSGVWWHQKSSWTSLVGTATDGMFSISNIIPAVTFAEQKPPEALMPNRVDAAKNIGGKQSDSGSKCRSESVARGSSSLGFAKDATSCDGQKIIPLEVGKDTLVQREKNSPALKGTADSEMGKSCIFMRSDASVKEWKKTKAALSSQLRKKGNDKRQILASKKA
ncbi:RNA recognition motif domain [Dillenia turbinata]|uniref:RNA recognition motif domain n=1 Tax=Dillenia turbinata TaxID=194707 RepID=A0AAN8VUB7_9MAGN